MIINILRKFKKHPLVHLILCLCPYAQSHALSLIARGVTIGVPYGAIKKPQLDFKNVDVYFSDPHRTKFSRNVMGNISILEYSTKTRLIDNQFRFLVAPAVIFEKGPRIGTSWHAGMGNPTLLGGLIHPLAPGLGIGGYMGVMPPLRSGIIHNNEWTLLNLNSITYQANDLEIIFNMIYGHPGVDLATYKKIKPNFMNLDFTLTKTLSGVQVGPIWYSSQDLNSKIRQHQFAIGGLIGTELNGWTIQFWFGHDVFAHNYERQTMAGYLRLKKKFLVD